MAGNTIVPNGSTCFRGLRLTRPSRQAVSSPNQCATKPCAASCSVMARTTGTTQVDARALYILKPELVGAAVATDHDRLGLANKGKGGG